MVRHIVGLFVLVSSAAGAPLLRHLSVKGCADFNVSDCTDNVGCEVQDNACVVSSQAKGCTDFNVSDCPTNSGCEVKDNACALAASPGSGGVDEPPAACLEACPAMTAAMSDMMAMEGKGGMSDMSGMFDTMCKHQDAMKCAASNPTKCGQMRRLQMDNTLAMMDCVCDACPSTKVLMGEIPRMMEALTKGLVGSQGNSTTASPESALDESMKMMCPMMESLECMAKEKTKCAALAVGMGDMSPETILAMKPACEKGGYALSITTTAQPMATVSSAVSASIGITLVGSFLLQ